MQLSSTTGAEYMKGELEMLIAVVASWLSGYGGYSQTPWVQVQQLLFFFLLRILSHCMSRLVPTKLLHV